jgi:uncharacterized phage protein gp47/JayE
MKDSTLKTCGCCEASAAPTPKEIDNRPGLSAIQYRVGTYASFRQAMVEAIACEPKLRDWTARASDDYGIALLEMWAYVADILTFYQERIANEAFLRTAVLRESVLRLANLLDYKPAPGMAATAYLAFILEKDKQVKITKGLRVQSVPGQGEKPQKFETVEAITATAALGKVRVFPVPTSVNPFKKNAEQAILQPSKAGTIGKTLSPGDVLIFFQPGHVSDTKRGIEQKKVVNLETDDDGYVSLSWTPAMQKDLPASARAFKLVRTLRVFGHNAPLQYIRTTAGTQKNPIVKTQLVERTDKDYEITIKKGSPFSFDGLYDDLKPGTKLLLHVKGGYLGMVTVDAVGQGQGSFNPLTDTVTQISVTASVYPNAFDRRKAVLYELGEEIVFWGQKFATEIAQNSLYVCVEAEEITAADLKGRCVILADGTAAELATVESAAKSTYGGAQYLKITLKSALTSKLATASAYLYGNVAKATHGETISDEVLGSGDASSAFQSFTLKKPYVTFVPKAGAPNGVANTLEVRVDGILWKEATNLYGHKGDERVYTTSVNDEEEMTVWFGDSVTGARLPTGRNNVTATYREGLGSDGNVKAEALKTLLDRPVGLKGAINPAAAQSGADPETLKKARANAPNTVRTFGRIVSLRDFEDAAREYTGVAKARAACVWDGEEQMVHLTVAGDKGAQVKASTMKDLIADLDSRRDPNRKLLVDAHQEVRVRVEASIQVHSDYVAKDVQTSAEKALQDYFAFDNLKLGQPIHLSDIFQVLQDVKGVVAVDVDYLNFVQEQVRKEHGSSESPVQSRLRIFHNELAVVKPTTDAVVKTKTEKKQ